MPIIKDGSDYIPFFWIGKRKVKIYIHDEEDTTYTFSDAIANADKFSAKEDARTLLDAVKAWFETL
jgi:hypothetical protein